MSTEEHEQHGGPACQPTNKIKDLWLWMRYTDGVDQNHQKFSPFLGRPSMDDLRYAVQCDFFGPPDFLMCLCGKNSNSVFRMYPGVLGEGQTRKRRTWKMGKKSTWLRSMNKMLCN